MNQGMLSMVVAGLLISPLGCATDGAGARTARSPSLKLQIVVTCGARVTLIDPLNRADGIRNGAEVTEIPSCERWTESGEASSEGSSNSTPITTFMLDEAREGQYLVVMHTQDAGEATISISGSIKGGGACTAAASAKVLRGKQYEWRGRVGISADSCLVRLAKAPSTSLGRAAK